MSLTKRMGRAGLVVWCALAGGCEPGAAPGPQATPAARAQSAPAPLAPAPPAPFTAPVEASRVSIALDIGDGLTMEFVAIQPGTFVMGSDPSREPQEKPQHEVTISRPFYLGRYEVTQAQWQSVMGTRPSEPAGPDLPVDMVSWDDCGQFLARLGERLGGLRLVLPTEAQWEYACRAGSTTNWSFGDDIEQFGEHGWFDLNSGGVPHPVGGRKPNAWGLHDMHGNVWEWCADWKAPYAAGPATDPAGPVASEGVRAIHGGSWRNSRALARSAYRFGSVPAGRHITVGFRVAMPLAQ